jgi:hypothetical protein
MKVRNNGRGSEFPVTDVGHPPTHVVTAGRIPHKGIHVTGSETTGVGGGNS